MFEKFGGRKMFVATVTVAVCIVTVIIKGDVPQGFKEILEYILGVFIGGNVLSDAASAFANKTAAAPQEVPQEVSQAAAPAAPAADSLAAVQAALDVQSSALSHLVNETAYLIKRVDGAPPRQSSNT